MQIINKSIRIIDYESNRTITRDTPASFNEYVSELIAHINTNVSVREYKTRSSSTEVIGSILRILAKNTDSATVLAKTNDIANRLLIKEIGAQQKVGHLDTNVQKGSLIQALIYEEGDDTYSYLLAKVEHSDFVDDSDFSFKTGFSKDKKTIWKSCLFDLTNPEGEQFSAKIYSNTVAKYWSDDFLELDQMLSDESNTSSAFSAIDSTLNQNFRGVVSRDHTIIRNSVILYFRSNEYIDYLTMVEDILGNYIPVDVEQDKIKSIKEKIKLLPQKKNFDYQFNSVPKAIDARIKKVYDVNVGIQLKNTDGIENISEKIAAYRDNDGTRYIKIKTNNDDTFKRFNIQ